MISQLQHINAWKLVCKTGDVLNGGFDSYEKARRALTDRQANGQALDGECVVRVQIAIYVEHGRVQTRVVN